MHKKYCPIIRDDCMGDRCQLWILDGQKVIKRKTHKSGIKDTSNCAIEKLGEQAVMQMWQESEKIINGEDFGNIDKALNKLEALDGKKGG